MCVQGRDTTVCDPKVKCVGKCVCRALVLQNDYGMCVLRANCSDSVDIKDVRCRDPNSELLPCTYPQDERICGANTVIIVDQPLAFAVLVSLMMKL